MQNPDAILVKMQDLKDNSDITRLKGVTEKDIKRTIRYYNFYLELELKAKKRDQANLTSGETKCNLKSTFMQT